VNLSSQRGKDSPAAHGAKRHGSWGDGWTKRGVRPLPPALGMGVVPEADAQRPSHGQPDPKGNAQNLVALTWMACYGWGMPATSSTTIRLFPADGVRSLALLDVVCVKGLVVRDCDKAQARHY
jgi:hypothetical protein